ncbi:hypothetical protein N8Q68_19450 [Enterobacter hormaechei subsp. hoffmannii]|nr:hypothetical protein [Enterobacter hormaechei subsp. hoffmannii]MCU2953955.1 hypothetical protein [Enterobacter hormaechei subsp. hoffmannii]
MTLTKEWLLKTIAELEEERDAVPGAVNVDAVMALEAMKRALASLEAEPVAYMYKDNLHADARFSLHTRFGNWSQEDINEYEITEIPLYTAPPAPASVPDVVSWEDVPEEITEDDIALASAWAHGFNQCRAAMLQGADGNSPVHSGCRPAQKCISPAQCCNSPVIPDGACLCCGRKQLKNRTCSVSGCDAKHVAHGFCKKHYDIERKKDPSRRESIRAADKRYRARKTAAPQQEVKS